MTHNLDLYKVFYYVAKTNSLTLAGKELGISQPAVSQNMKQLEERLNMKLFHRTSRGIRLTSEGETLYSYVEKGYETIEQGEKKMHEIVDLEGGELTIACPQMILDYLLPDYIAAFHGLHPNVKFNFQILEKENIISSIKENRIDLGIITGNINKQPDMKIAKIGSSELIMVVGENYAYLSGQPLPMQIISHLPLILPGTGTYERRLINEFFIDNNINKAADFTLDSFETIVQFAIRDMGIGFVPEGYAKTAIKGGLLYKLNLLNKPRLTNISCIYKESILSSGTVSAFLELLKSPIK